MATVLSVIQESAAGIKQPQPQLVVSNADKFVAELLVCFNHVGWLMRRRYEWPQLVKKNSLVLSSGISTYALPGDFLRMVPDTFYDESQHWDLIGPVTPQEDRYLKAGQITDVGPRRRYRVFGTGRAKLDIQPVPTGDDTGKILSFEYISENWILPPEWQSATVVSAGTYRSYDGNIYYSELGGTTGVNPPEHTTGDDSDGGVTWTYSTALYDRPLSDSDIPIFDSRLLSLGVEWVWLQRNGMDFEPRQIEWQREVSRESSRLSGGRILSYVGGTSEGLVNWGNIPDSGFGG